MQNSKDLLILSCSNLKKNVNGELPALYLYDGPAYRILRSHIHQYGWPTNLQVGILSAEYGLIGCMTPISYYDRRMTPERSAELRDSVKTKLIKWAGGCESMTFICGKDYLETFNSGERRGRSGKSPAFRPWDESEALPASDMLNDNYLT